MSGGGHLDPLADRHAEGVVPGSHEVGGDAIHRGILGEALHEAFEISIVLVVGEHAPDGVLAKIWRCPLSSVRSSSDSRRTRSPLEPPLRAAVVDGVGEGLLEPRDGDVALVEPGVAMLEMLCAECADAGRRSA